MKIPTRFAALSGRAPSRDHLSAITQFLTEIWDYDPREYTMLYTRAAGTEHMRPHPIRYDRAKKITEVIDQYPYETHDIYFCPNSFDRPYNKKEHALSTRYAWSDIDDADPSAFKPKPNILWETSAGRYQGLWIWCDTISAREAESYSEALWNLYGGDAGAWAVNKLLRVPGTINHKRERNGEIVRLLRFNERAKRVPDEVREAAQRRAAPELGSDIDPFKHDPQKTILKYRRAVGLYVGTLLTADQPLRRGDMGRSEIVYLIMKALIQAGASNDEVACVLWVNIYFNAKWRGDLRELERQIVKIRGDVEAGR